MNPSALTPARDPQDLVHSPWSVPIPAKETSTQQSRGRHSHAPWVSHHSVPSWLGPRTLRMCVYLVCMELIRGAQPRSDCQMLCVDLSCLDPRTVTGETFCLVLRPAHPASCIVSHDVFEWSTPAVSSSSDRVPDHLTVGRNLHMKNAGTITSTPGRSVWFPNPRWRVRHMVSNRGHCAVVKPLVRVGSVGTTPANHCTTPILAQGFEL